MKKRYPGLKISYHCRFCLLIITIFSALSLLPGSLASLDEVYGVVTDVIDGDTFDIRIEKADSRITNSIEVVTLADVSSPDMKTVKGPAARDFTYAVLMNKRVYLDIDDFSNRGRDGENRLVAVAYLAGAYGQPMPYPNFNILLVDSGHAMLVNQTDNEFDPKDWKDDMSQDSESQDSESQDSNSQGSNSQDSKSQHSSSDPLQRVEEDLRERLKGNLPGSGQEQEIKNDGLQNESQNGLLSRIEDAAGEELDRATRAAWDWLKSEITNTSQDLVNSSLDRALNGSYTRPT